jgi:hypothetical protein
MTQRERFTFSEEPSGEAYRGVLEFGLRSCDVMLVVVRKEASLSARGAELMSRLASNALEVTDETSWPGTVLHGHTARVHRFRFNSRVRDIVLAATGSLFGWGSGLPEDPCLLSSTGEPWLVTITHERDAYLDLPLGHLELLEFAVPTLRLTRDGPTPETQTTS